MLVYFSKINILKIFSKIQNRNYFEIDKKIKIKKKVKIDKKSPKTVFKPRTEEQFQSTIKVQTADIKNKIKRQQIWMKRKLMLQTIKAKARKNRKSLPAEQRQKPITIEDKQLATDSHLVQNHPEHQVDQFNKILNNEEGVKIMLTTSQKPTKKLYDFLKEIMILFPKIYYYPRQDYKLEEIYGYAKNLGYSHVIIVRDSGRWELLIRKIDGCLAIFKMTNIVLSKDIYHKGLATDHHPELILNNFNSKIGIKVGRLLSTLFPQNPQFKGRRVVTFHNQRDFIFVRHHRYIFKDEFSRVNMQQIGPRFTLQLRNLYEGGDNNRTGDLQFAVKDEMYVDRAKIYL